MRKPESITLHRKNADIYSRNYSRHKAKGERQIQKGSKQRKKYDPRLPDGGKVWSTI
mgnify:FL=1